MSKIAYWSGNEDFVALED